MKNKLNILENEVQKTFVDLLHLYGYKIAHFKTSLTKNGDYLTATGFDAKGFPDLICINKELRSLIVIELKKDNGVVSPEQKEWLEYFASITKDVYVIKLEDFEDLKNRLEEIKACVN